MLYHCTVVEVLLLVALRQVEVEEERHRPYESVDGHADYRGNRDSLSDYLHQAPILVCRSRSFRSGRSGPLPRVKITD